MIIHWRDVQLVLIGHAIPAEIHITSGELVIATAPQEMQDAIFLIEQLCWIIPRFKRFQEKRRPSNGMPPPE